MTIDPINMQFQPSAPAPSRSDRANYADVGDGFMAYIESLGPELETFRGLLNVLITAFNHDIQIVSGGAATALAASKFKGVWPNLIGGGSLDIFYSCYYATKYWMLVTPLPDWTTSEPGVDPEWVEIPYETFQYDQDVNAAGYRQINTRFQDTCEVAQILGTLTADTEINIENGNIVVLTVGGDIELSVANLAPAGNYSELLLIVFNGGAYPFTLPSAWWIKDTGDLTQVFSENDKALRPIGLNLLYYFTIDGGTTKYGIILR